MNTDSNISNIQDFLWGLFDSDLFPNKYFDELPSVCDFDTAIVIDCSNQIRDMDAYSSGSFLLFLYAKPLENGMRNVKALKAIENEVARIVSNNSDKTYYISQRYSHSDYDATRNLHATIIEFNITI